jgi:hypothetical protein
LVNITKAHRGLANIISGHRGVAMLTNANGGLAVLTNLVMQTRSGTNATTDEYEIMSVGHQSPTTPMTNAH